MCFTLYCRCRRQGKSNGAIAFGLQLVTSEEAHEVKQEAETVRFPNRQDDFHGAS